VGPNGDTEKEDGVEKNKKAFVRKNKAATPRTTKGTIEDPGSRGSKTHKESWGANERFRKLKPNKAIGRSFEVRDGVSHVRNKNKGKKGVQVD